MRRARELVEGNATHKNEEGDRKIEKMEEHVVTPE
jgi:hypothetical protein